MPTALGVSDLSASYMPLDATAYYATDHGVVADGVTDDAPALNALIASVSAGGGGRVVLPRNATCRITSTISMAANVILEGYGYSSVISLGANVPRSGMIVIGAISNVTVQNLRLVGNRSTYTSLNSGIWAPAPGGRTNIRISGVTVEDVNYAGIAVLGDTNRVVVNKNVRITDCATRNTGAHGILIQWGVDNAHIDHCTVEAFAQFQPDVCGITNGRQAYDTSIRDCFVDGAGSLGRTQNAISLDWAKGRCVCTGNTVVNAQSLGIEIGGCYDTLVANNTVTDGAKSGIQFTGYIPQEQTSLGVTVSNNVVARCTTGIGMQLGGDTAAITTPAARRVIRGKNYGANSLVVQRTRLYKAATGGVTAATEPATLGYTVTGGTVTDGAAVWTDQGPVNADITISANTITNCSAHGIETIYAYGLSITGNHISRCTRSGIRINTSCNLFTIVGNDLDANNVAGTSADGNLRIETLYNVAHVGEVAHNSSRDSGLAGTEFYFTESGVRFDNRLLPNVTTPTVAFSDVFQSSNTATTNISNFLDGNARTRVITVYVNDTHTTFVHSAAGSTGIRLAGGANYSAPINTVMQFALTNGTQWFEVSRVNPG
ncbi:right-handed parallel beta-helix repeat-containing protein [Arthrobacter sp. NPDC080073]|uniref:right-handed parallel beta-helix repeat-containing protein n=1 Tax=Arthrobacter sp. NPDC080073 TaxID=3155919 RepID=UPI00343DBD47